MVIWLVDDLGTAPCNESFEGDIYQVDVTDLVEGKGNDKGILQKRIIESTTALRAGRKVVLCCDRGIVRSNTLAIAVMMCLGLTYKEAVGVVSNKVSSQAINIDLLNDALQAVNLIRT